ncbi:MAG TPA: cytochrome d ubiquinol oxidase subunit II [Gemmatimonadaceae bacterium]|nr:cytochrome d ubiquinol oxidase subunit II [Gemmatimonadaceae bacterium]
MDGSTAALLVAGALGLALNAYVLLAGADFGGGVWDLLARGPRCDRQRALIANAIAPVWEANHVWLILAVVLLFACFPPAFARLSVVLHIPLTLMLVGIVLRGSAFIFRAYDTRDDATQRRWGIIFAVASTITPVLLGVCIGAVASGAVGRAAHAADAAGVSFADVYLRPWLAPFPLGVGALALALFAFIAAVYLTVEARDEPLQDDFRRRALAAAGAVFVVAFGVLALAQVEAPAMAAALTRSGWALGFHLATGAAALTAIGALWRRAWRVARAAAAVQVSCILWGWLAGQFPYLIPPSLTIGGAAAPPATLRLVLWGLAAGAVVLFPSLYYLMRVFKGPRARPAAPRGDA